MMRGARALGVVGVVLLGLTGLTACEETAAPKKVVRKPKDPEPEVRTMNVVGSDTLIDLTKRWAYMFKSKYPEIRVQIKGGGSGKGIAALIDGKADLAMSSRPIKKEEAAKVKEKTGEEVTEIPVALDGIAFFVNEDNPIKALTLEQLKGIFSGQITRWTALGGPDAPITVYTRESASGTYAFVKEAVLHEGDYGKSAVPTDGHNQMIDSITRGRWSIGFGAAAFGKGVATVAVRLDKKEDVLPTAETVRNGRYPLARKLYFYVAGIPEGDIKAFVDFARSDEAQAEAQTEGFYGLK